MMKHAVAIGIRADDPTRDVKAIRIRSPGHHTWTEVEIAAFEGCHPVGSRGRLALALLLYTGQRRGDVIRMGTQHVRDGVLSVKQEKTGIELAIPIHADLERALAASSSGHLTFLTTKYDRPFTAIGFSNWFRHQCDAAGLPHCSAHGLSQGGRPPVGRGRVYAARNRGHHRTRQSRRARPLHQGGRSAALS